VRYRRLRAAAVLAAALAASGGILAVTQTAATAAVRCTDQFEGVDRVSTRVGNAGFDGPVLKNLEVVSTLGGNDMVSVELGTVRVTVCLGDGDDTFEGAAPGATRPAPASQFSVDGGPGSDGIEGGDGNDRISGGDGADMIVGEDGGDIVIGGAGNDDLHGGKGNDNVTGDSGDDYLFGDEGDDRLSGGDGDNVIDGGPGTDTCIGPGTFINCEIVQERP